MSDAGGQHEAVQGPWRATWREGATVVQVWHAEQPEHPMAAVNVYDHETGRVTLTDPDDLAVILAEWVDVFAEEYAAQVGWE